MPCRTQLLERSVIIKPHEYYMILPALGISVSVYYFSTAAIYVFMYWLRTFNDVNEAVWILSHTNCTAVQNPRDIICSRRALPYVVTIMNVT